MLAGFTVAHEFTHAGAMRLFGNHLVFGVIAHGLALYASSPGQQFTRNQYVVTLLAPLVVPSLVGVACMPLVSGPVLAWLVCCLGVNAVGAGADVQQTLATLRYPPDARIVDEIDGMRILLIGGANR
jgi:hypothetical protein